MKYYVKDTHIKRNGKRYGPGDEIEMNEKEAGPLRHHLETADERRWREKLGDSAAPKAEPPTAAAAANEKGEGQKREGQKAEGDGK